jgi:protein tyrosine/serine phosphatase
MKISPVTALPVTTLIVLLIAAPPVKTPAQTITKPDEKTPTSVKRHLEPAADLPNFHMVHPYLYRGGEPSQKGLAKLKSKGIKTIIDLRAPGKLSAAERSTAEGVGIRYINLPMSDKAPTKEQVETFLETVKEAKSKDAPVFVHCAHGSDRTGCLVGIWRVSEDNYSYADAYKEMRRYFFGPQYKALSQAVKVRAKS